jgi:hypothetical protein
VAYDQGLAQRIREIIAEQPGLEEKTMFGGVGFLLHGNMAVEVNKEELIVRTGPENFDELVAKPHVRPFDITGRPMSGWVMVAASGYEADEDLQAWVQAGVGFALSLPPK